MVCGAVGAGAAGPGSVRHSVIAGTWYPGDPKRLRAMIEGFLQNVPSQPLDGELIGLIAPHAGYVYSGQVAAYAYAHLHDRSFPKVIVVSPVHRVYPGRFAVTDKAYYETPLGLVPVAGELVQAIERHIKLNRVAHDMEHSLEIQLPFLQHALGDFALAPIMMGDQDWESACQLGQALAEAVRPARDGAVRPAQDGTVRPAQDGTVRPALDGTVRPALDGTARPALDGTLLVASTDLSHFHRHEEAQRLDQLVLDRITAYDPQGLARTLALHQAEACGGGPVVSVMVAAEKLGANRALLLKYVDSSDVTGDHSSVVGYAAAALLRT